MSDTFHNVLSANPNKQLFYFQEHTYTKYVREIYITGRLRFACRMCGAHYQSAPNCYHNHVKVKHLGKKKFCCQFCTFTSPYKASMQNHITKKHPDAKPVTCSQKVQGH